MRVAALALLGFACAASGRRVQASDPETASSAKELAAFLLASKEPAVGWQAAVGGNAGLSSTLPYRSSSPVMQYMKSRAYRKQKFMRPLKYTGKKKGERYPVGPFGGYGVIGEEEPEQFGGGKISKSYNVRAFQECQDYFLLQQPIPTLIQPDMHNFFSLETLRRAKVTPIAAALNFICLTSIAIIFYLLYVPNEFNGWDVSEFTNNFDR